MATINELVCTALSGNTGVASCSVDIKNIVGVLIAPRGYEFDVTSLQATLAAATLNASKTARLYPLWDFETTKDQSEAKTVQSMGTGAKQVVREGFNDWSFQFVAGGLLLNNQLRKFNGKAWDVFFVDSDNKILGIAGSTATKLKAIPLGSQGGFMWFEAWKLNDATKIAEYMAQFVYNQKYTNDLLKFVVADFDLPTTLYGLQNVTLSSVVSAVAGTYTVKGLLDNGTNVGDFYATALADPAMWTAKNALSGATITITGVTYNSTTKLFALVLTTTAPPYPGTGEFLNIDLAAPSVLDAAGVVGYESTGAVSIVKN